MTLLGRKQGQNISANDRDLMNIISIQIVWFANYMRISQLSVTDNLLCRENVEKFVIWELTIIEMQLLV